MAHVILTAGQFSSPGFHKLAINSTNINDLSVIIDQWEKFYLYQMLSNNTPTYASGLADLFIADAQANGGVPIIARFVKIFNPFNEQYGDEMKSSKGMLDIFQSLIEYHYVTEMATYSGTGGITAGNSSASKTLDIANAYRHAESRFNDALVSIEAILWWIQTGNANGGGTTQYPEYVRPSSQTQRVFKAKYQSIL